MTRAPTKPDPAADLDMAATDPRRRVQRRRYKIRGAETWALIRESYLAGAPARELATRYDVTEWAIWRRAWKQGWTKQDRVEAPPPALAPVTPQVPPGAEADPAALTRLALNGLAEALRQNRLAEARNLAQIVASLERIGGGLGGQFTLADMVRVIFDSGYQIDVMRMNPDTDNPPEKHDFWTLKHKQETLFGHVRVDERNRGYASGRAELRAELGLEPEEDRGDAWEWRGGGTVRLR